MVAQTSAAVEPAAVEATSAPHPASVAAPSISDDPLSRLSIVLPVGPGDTAWPPLSDALRAQASAAELLPVFAADDAQAAPIGALRAATGRARQQNAGAAAASRPWLWFVHADSRLDADTLPALRSFLVGHADDAHVLGWFRLRFGSDDAGMAARMRMTAAGANWRSRHLGLPFGDQGLLLPAQAFADLGGFDEGMAYGEDLALVWRARRAGLRLREIDACLSTSARRYRSHGWLRTTLRHLWLTAALAGRESRR